MCQRERSSTVVVRINTSSFRLWQNIRLGWLHTITSRNKASQSRYSRFSLFFFVNSSEILFFWGIIRLQMKFYRHSSWISSGPSGTPRPDLRAMGGQFPVPRSVRRVRSSLKMTKCFNWLKNSLPLPCSVRVAGFQFSAWMMPKQTCPFSSTFGW